MTVDETKADELQPPVAPGVTQEADGKLHGLPPDVTLAEEPQTLDLSWMTDEESEYVGGVEVLMAKRGAEIVGVARETIDLGPGVRHLCPVSIEIEPVSPPVAGGRKPRWRLVREDELWLCAKSNHKSCYGRGYLVYKERVLGSVAIEVSEITSKEVKKIVEYRRRCPCAAIAPYEDEIKKLKVEAQGLRDDHARLMEEAKRAEAEAVEAEGEAEAALARLKAAENEASRLRDRANTETEKVRLAEADIRSKIAVLDRRIDRLPIPSRATRLRRDRRLLVEKAERLRRKAEQKEGFAGPAAESGVPESVDEESAMVLDR